MGRIARDRVIATLVGVVVVVEEEGICNEEERQREKELGHCLVGTS